MPTTEVPFPSPTIWDQYTVAGILFVVFIVIGVAVYRVFHEYMKWQTTEGKEQRNWQEAQFAKREAENRNQRAWYEEMERKREEAQAQRDRQWQQFYTEIQDQQAKQNRENNEVMTKLISRIDALTEVMTSHDRSSRERAARFEDLAGSLSGKVAARRRTS